MDIAKESFKKALGAIKSKADDDMAEEIKTILNISVGVPSGHEEEGDPFDGLDENMKEMLRSKMKG